MTSPRLLLIRHGRSAHVHREGWVDVAGQHRWHAAYDAAGISATDAPPRALVDEVARASLIVSSDLPRAIASANRLAPARDVVITPLVREMPQTIPSWVPGRLPPMLWHSVVTGHWFWEILRGTDASPEQLATAATASAWLTRLAAEHGMVAVVTHGVFRRLLGRRLQVDGWRAERRRGGYRHWSVWPFTPNPPA